MPATHLIAARVTPETKARFRALAEQQQVSESVLLKRLIDLHTRSISQTDADVLKPPHRRIRGERLCIRLRAEDQLLLSERAAGRQMAAATYVSVLVRAHLRSLSPLPKEELEALRRGVAVLSAIGRNLNQFARAADQGVERYAAVRSDVMSFIQVCTAMLGHIKELIKANTRSWETGHE